MMTMPPMAATAATVPLASDPLSPATQAYLHERVADACAPRCPRRLDIRLYQCLADDVSVQALCRDLLACANGSSSLVAVFECPAPAPEHGFVAALREHLMQMERMEPNIRPVPAAHPGDVHVDTDEWRIRVLGRDFLLIAMHADAERLSRVMPCPVLVFHPLQGEVLC
jgi:YqcI/YcgG family